MYPLLAPVAVLGLVVGSFLNVVIHRLPRNESLVRPASRCPECATAIRPRHNVPVLSWLVLRGRCAHCRVRISARYPLVELGTAALFVVIAARFGLSWSLPAYLYLAAAAVALALIDLDLRRLPDAIVLPSYLVGVALLGLAGAVDRDWTALARAGAGMAVLWALYATIRGINPRGMGRGDVTLAGLLGLYLGWLGWGALAVGAFAGFLIGGTVAFGLLATRRADRKTAIPFGPAMLAGALVAVVAAGPVWTWYCSLLTPTL